MGEVSGWVDGATGALGLEDPVLAYNLSAVADWSPQMAFLDLMKMSRPWIGHQHGRWGGQNVNALRARGLLDADGWPTRIPPDLDRIGTIFAWDGQPLAADSREGIYILNYRGEGALELGQDAHALSVEPGRIVFENIDGNAFTLDIVATDPDGTGDYVRDISIVRADYMAFHEAGAVFNPDWLAVVADARLLRFMDWMRTNGSAQVQWSGRPEVGDVTWMLDGVPVEAMVTLANLVGADPWFTMPHKADDAYIQAFATQVRDHLDPRLKAHVELSNEVWNRAFGQNRDLANRAEEIWGSRDATSFYLKRATETAQIWDDVFGDEADARLVKVLAGQSVNSWLTGEMLSAEGWVAAEPRRALSPSDVFDAFAVATYFGARELRDPSLRAELLLAIESPGTDAAAWLHNRLLDPTHPGSMFQEFKSLAGQKALAEVHGLDLLAYEGGQHLHQHLRAHGLAAADSALLDGFMADFVRSVHMASLYGAMWDFWAGLGDGPFMQYADVGAVGPHGSWGAVAGLSDSTPRSALMATRNAGARRWWHDDRPEPGFQHGVYRAGNADGNLLLGTSEEDFLAGHAGDDVLVGGRGDDGIHGGAGYDIARFNGSFAQYRIELRAGGHVLIGPDGTDYLLAIEEVVFADGARVALSDRGYHVIDAS